MKMSLWADRWHCSIRAMSKRIVSANLFNNEKNEQLSLTDLKKKGEKKMPNRFQREKAYS